MVAAPPPQPSPAAREREFSAESSLSRAAGEGWGGGAMKFGVGQPIRRVEDLRLLTGKGRYQDDQTLHRQTWCVFVRSHYAHARIRSVDTQAASRASGVVAVFTGTDYANDGIAMPKAAMPRKKRD